MNDYSPSVNSRVPQIVRHADGSIELTVAVAGYKAGKYVEVYGYITQDSGTFGGFRKDWAVTGLDKDGVAKLTVTIPAGQLTLKDEPITVLTWISEVWPSMLTSATKGNETVWTINDPGQSS